MDVAGSFVSEPVLGDAGERVTVHGELHQSELFEDNIGGPSVRPTIEAVHAVAIVVQPRHNQLVSDRMVQQIRVRHDGQWTTDTHD